jgi:hypothetical protein
MRSREKEMQKLMTKQWSSTSLKNNEEYRLGRALTIDTIALICYDLEQFRSFYLATLLMDLSIGDDLHLFGTDKHKEAGKTIAMGLFTAIKYCEMDPVDLKTIQDIL